MTDHLNIGIWEKLDSIRDESLRQKAANLPALFNAAFAPGTISKYRRAWHRWVKWTSNYLEVLHCPADPFFVCFFLNDLVVEKSSVSTVISAFCGIRWGHLNTGFESPTDSPIVKLAFEGAKRLLSKNSTNRKEPFTAEMIKTLVAKYEKSENLMHRRFIILCIFGFAGFFRISELLSIRLKHLKIEKDSAQIFIEKSKTDQLRDGNTVYIAKTGSTACPCFDLQVSKDQTWS